MHSLLLQHSCSKSLPLSFKSASPVTVDHALAHPGIVPNVCLEVSQNDCGFVSFNLS